MTHDSTLAPSRRANTLARLRAWLRPPRRLRFTREGRYFVAINVGIGLAAINTGNNLLYLLLGWMLSVIIASGLLSERGLRGLRVRRRPPARIFAGRPFLMEISVENTKRSLASYSIEVEDLVSDVVLDKKCYFLKIPSGRTQRTSYRHVFGRRGAYRFTGFRVGTKFPFALFRKSRDLIEPTQVVVYPQVYPIAVPPPRAHYVGGEAARQIGRRGEFFGLREYRDGDDRRDIHWRSTARSGRPLVREFEEESERQAVVVLDNALAPEALKIHAEKRKQLEREARKRAKQGPAAGSDDAEGVVAPEQAPEPDRDDPVEAMERAISAAASMAAAYLQKGYAVEFIARGVRVPMSAGQAQLTRILEALALLDIATEQNPFAGAPDPRLESVVIFPTLAGAQHGRPQSPVHVVPVD